MTRHLNAVEWPTLGLLLVCYGLWALATTVVAAWWMPAGFVLATLMIALHASLTHEIVHDHPFPGRQRLNEALVFPVLGLLIPLGRFRDTHLAHHNNAVLTDPYDDPESNYLDPAIWARLPRWVQGVLRFNNTLAGRMLIGPVVSQIAFMHGDLRQARAGDARVVRGWLWHIPSLALVALWVVLVAEMPVWLYLTACYAAMSILKIRTFLEHQAEERASDRTVIIEDRGPLSWMFLNNNLHVVHHMHPRVPWYGLPAVYFANRARYLGRNGGYMYRSYVEVFRRHFWRAKDPVPHPLWERDGAAQR
ncbi:MAG: fatty acid desaturase [Pseudomonadota bacterium]